MPETVVVEDGDSGVESAAVGGALAAGVVAGAAASKADQAQADADAALAQAQSAQVTADAAARQPVGVSPEDAAAIADARVESGFEKLAAALSAQQAPAEPATPPPAPPPPAAEPGKEDQLPKSVGGKQKKTLRERWGG